MSIIDHTFSQSQSHICEMLSENLPLLSHNSEKYLLKHITYEHSCSLFTELIKMHIKQFCSTSNLPNVTIRLVL